jgi:hypothetical protein
MSLRRRHAESELAIGLSTPTERLRHVIAAMRQIGESCLGAAVAVGTAGMTFAPAATG